MNISIKFISRGVTMLIVIIHYIIFIITLIYSLYFATTGVIGLLKKRKPESNKVKDKNYFAILIPARNEEAVIGNLIDSLNSENYDKDKYKIYVLPNNCTDNTKKVALAHHASVIECTGEIKTKGDVLKIAFEKLSNNKEIDAYIIFDADNIVHPDFLEHMNACLSSGGKVAQGFRDAKNASDNWLSGSYSIFYLFQNIFFNRSRMSLNGSASINGTGFMIKKELLDKKSFTTFTLTEDVEFTGQCALNNEKVVYVEDAITYDEHPCDFLTSWKQRKRWTAGMLECQRIYSPKLIKNFLKTGNIASLDMALIYSGPIIQLLIFFDIILSLILQSTNTEYNILFSHLSINGILGLVSTYLIALLVELFVILYKKKNPAEVLSGIIFFLVFIITWVPINIVCLLKKQTKWEEIKHSRNINIDEMVK